MQSVLPFPVQMPSADPTVGEVVNLYLSVEAKIETRPAKVRRSWAENARILRAFEQAHGTLYVSECRKAHLRLWLDAQLRLGPWSKNRWNRVIQRAFNWAADDMEVIARNPFKGVRFPKGPRRRDLSEGEYEALLRVAGAVFRPVLQFNRLTGARPIEMANARWDDLRVDEGIGAAWIELAEHKTSHHPNAKPRLIALGKQALDLLIGIRQHLGVLPGLEPEHIFLNHRRKAWTRNALCLQFAKARAKAGLAADAKLYGLRHRFVTGARENGISLADAGGLAGHASPEMTKTYDHSRPDMAALCRLAEQAVAKKPPSPPVEKPPSPPVDGS